MDADHLIKAAIAIAPVVVLLIVFDRLDVFNLITFREIAILLGVGGAIAALSFVANWRVLDGFPIGASAYSRYVAPVIEESLKAAPILYLFSANRLGFKIDAAIAGFAIGAGFSIVENLWYLLAIIDANVSAWLVRGFGTAVMHGSATALFAIISHEMTERQSESAAARYRFNPLLFAPGLAVAMVIHSTFNHFAEQPLLIMALTLLLAPLTLFFTLARSAQATMHWLKADEDAHRKLLDEIHADAALSEDSRAYVELKLELVLRAEELIRASYEGGTAKAGALEVEKFKRLDAIEAQLGKPALEPLNARLGLSRNDLWELNRLRRAAR